MKRYLHIIYILGLLLVVGGITNNAWAAKVTYHILTLPINNSIYHMKDAVSGHRLEALKIVVDNQTQVELPAHYKSPLATGFTYYKPDDITKGGSAISLYDNVADCKGILYDVKTSPTPSPVAEGTAITTNTAEYYVVYTYNSSNTIAKLDGTVNYNIGVKNKGFLSLNRGRNNRPAVIPTAKADPEMLASEDFSYVKDPGNNIGTYWKDGNNKNKQEDVESQFFFGFKFEGVDPYNIIIRTSYNRDITFIEKNENTSNFVYKWYKGAALMASGTGNAYLASDDHIQYNLSYNISIYPENPTNLTEGAGTGYITQTGYFHGNKQTWGTVALLNNTTNNGYVFIGTRNVDANGNVPGPTNENKYYFLTFDGYNNLKFTQNTAANATTNHTIDGIYPLKKVTFKIATPFYKAEATTDHIVSAPTEWVSQYTVDNDPIETKYLPAALKRKYCNFNGKFYKDARCREEDEITYFSEATQDPTEGYQVYVGYDVSPAAPKFLLPSASYTTATWYELTDAGSTQEYGRKIKNNSGTYKNNGANGEYSKESEFALVGDPYEVKVLYRKGTEDAGSNSYVTLSTYDTWDIPNDETVGSFLLRKYNDTGYWNWDPGQASENVTYGSDITPSVGKDAQTITINLSGLNGSKYYKITTGGTDASQIVSVTPRAGYVYAETATTATIAINLAANTGVSNKTMTLTIQEYNDNEGETPSESPANPTVITITQGTASSAFAGNVVDYSTTNYTRVKVLTLPTRTFTYNIVDKSGRIAVKASTSQTIFSALSLASIPSIIVSPFLVGETVTFYDDAYTDNDGRGTLSSEITETPDTDHDIFVTYTTSALNAKPYKLSEDQEIFVRLNGQYIYYEDGVIKTSTASQNNDKYKWKLRNRDPYNMLIDNMAAREDLSVSGTEHVTVYNDEGVSVTDDGVTPATLDPDTRPSRQMGAWVWLNNVALPSTSEGTALAFTSDRTKAEHFIAKSSTAMGVYEVMVATGSSIDASTTYYNIGRPADNTVKIYNNTTYAHGNPVLAFRLEQLSEYTYHLIDKAKHELLTVSSKSPELVLPAEYQSPLVGTYNYYGEENITITGDIYEPTDASVKIDNLDAVYTKTSGDYSSDWEKADSDRKKTAIDATDVDTQAKELKVTGHVYFRIGETSTYYDVNVTKRFHDEIYVTYEVNDIVTFNTGQYMLKFLEPFAAGYHLEDGNDNLTSDKIQAVYPYCNGDGNLNIYGTAMNEEQMKGGASTRPRWVWYFASSDSDPYHVAIRSRSTISYNGIANPTYLTTYVVHFNQDAEGVKKVVTGGTLPGIASVEPTEYMVLGTVGNYQLLTTKEIDDGTTNERRKVTSLEQYWKTYNMIKKDVLDIDVKDDPTYADAYSDDESTWVVPTAKRDDLEDALNDKGVGRGQWHSYDAYANATRWNGYNDKSDGHEKKVVEKLEHWFQTFDMGTTGTFDIESADIPPVLVLLDLHGWEIMRLPLPTVNYPEGDDELAALRAYDSPMVKEYKFYSQATKASGCHKYSLRMQNDAERDQIKVNGEHYTSTSLGNLPPITATGVKSGGAFNDQFVTYTVKEEYVKSYDYTYNESTHEETEEPSRFLMVQHGRFYKTENSKSPNTSYITKPVSEHTNPEGGNVFDMILNPKNHGGTNDNIIDGSGHWIGNCLWYIKPNQNIDKEMGIKYAAEAGSTGEPWTELEYKKYYYDNGKAGFDPYNLQIQLLKDNNGDDDLRYLSSHITSTRLDNGVMIGDYSGSGGTIKMTLETGFSYVGVDPLVSTGSSGYDHTNLTISNQTFMAVSDANGNMQLMPRFDHTKRVDLDDSSPWETTLEDPVNHAKASADDNASMGSQTTFFVRPQIFEYKIINNSGNESIRYKRSGDYYPAITDHFKSPLATDFTYYKGLAEYDDPVDNGTTSTQWDAATGDHQRTATTYDLMSSQINLLTAKGTYEYRVGTRGSFNYYTIEVTKGLQEQQITGSFADAGLNDDDCEVVVRYDYDTNADHDGDRILEGKWFTVKLANKDLQSSGTIVTTGATKGTGVYLYADDTESPTKPGTIDEDDKIWQWKFLQAPTDPSSDYYEAPDPYDVRIFNRSANYTENPSLEPSPMAVGIKVPNANDGADRFALLSHTSGGYALAVAGSGAYTYKFVNGASMTTSVAATTATETDFTQKAGIFDGVKSQLIVNDDVEHNFEYKVINNSSKYAVNARQNNEGTEAHEFFPYLPDSAQTPLLRMKDYKYYGFATPSSSPGCYDIIPQTILYTLYGLYDDVVWVRYGAYDMDSTEFKIPNIRNATGTGQVARGASSVDVAMNIKGGLPYNIIWDSDDMMQSTDNSAVSDGNSHALSGNTEFVWYFTGDDPYGLKIKHKGGKYLNGTSTMVAEGSAPTFMLLKNPSYDYGILQKTGDDDILSGYGQTTVTTNPTKYIIFGLSIHNLKYHLIIANTGNTVNIDFRETESGTLTTKTINGTTQRDLTSVNTGEGTHYAGEKYQLGSTLSWGNPAVYHTYSYDAGSVSIGDELVLPNIFYRPNCLFDFYIEGIYTKEGNPITALEDKYKGLKRTRLMTDETLIDQDVVVNVVYKFDTGLATNAGLDFVTSVGQNLWYTFETADATPQLAHYTFVRGMRAEEGRALHYTNDYLWSPLGDPYGFKSYNRYIYKNNGGTTEVLTTDYIDAGEEVKMGATASNANRDIYELLPSTNPNSGTFRVHPLLNTDNTLFLSVVESGDPGDPEDGKLVLSADTPVKEWTYGLSQELMNPYYQGAGNVGGLNDAGKTAYENAQTTYAANPMRLVRELQTICYNDDNIVPYSPGYYRLCNQPGASSLSPQRYASGYLHDIEKTAGESSTAIPMHFYSKVGTSTTFAGEGGLGSGFTETAATRGEIPIPATEYDASTIFLFTGSATGATIQTQGLYVQGVQTTEHYGHAVMTAEGEPTSFKVADIGGAVVIIYNDEDSRRHYINYARNDSIYELKYYENVPVDGSKWCMEPAKKQGLKVATNQGGDGHYYATFYAPFDVLLPNDGGGHTYYAYYCKTWDNAGLHPTAVPAATVNAVDYAEGKFVPAGTPVIIRITDETDVVTLTLPTTSPTTVSSITTDLLGTYLEQLLTPDASNVVYTLGLPFTSAASIDDPSTGVVTAPKVESAKTGVGFYINATPNKEHDALQSMWQRNNNYVLHNKVYYRAPSVPSGGAKSRKIANKPQFVPVLFDDIEEEEIQDEEQTQPQMQEYGNGVYDLSGRKVASEEQVQDGTWRQRLSPGIYIVQGKKIKI